MPEKILIVDDDLETLRLVGIMLQRQGYTITAANSGSQAISMAKNEQPDLILLDVMMPEMDGYEVARQLRADTDLSQIPILMFTAKSQVEDKVTGYESGADDYLTKPTHPAELNAHIKALLSRTGKLRLVAAHAPAPEKGYVIGVIGARGGVGASTLGLNLAVTLVQKNKLTVNAAELRPGNGTWGLELGYLNPEALRNLLQYKPSEITQEVVESEIITNASGVRLLLSGYQPREADALTSTAHFEAILKQLSFSAAVSIVDLGAYQIPCIERILTHCNEVILVVDPHPIAVARAKAILEDLESKGFGKAKLVTIVLLNRLRADIQLSWSQVQESLSQPVAVVFTPVPELTYQAALRLTPMVMLQPDGLHNQQFGKLAELIVQHAHKG
ncbi:MAG TPA: response regulator [Anaerolineaceae bacterium]|jgi:pilus assembly protein CpaE